MRRTTATTSATLLLWLSACTQDVVPNEDGSTSSGVDTSTSVAATDATSSSAASETESSTAGDDATIAESTSSGAAESTGSGAAESTSSGSTTDATLAPSDDVYKTPTDVALEVGEATGLLANDLDPLAEGLTIVEADDVSERGGTVDVDASGAFRYTPVAGDWGSDRFEYTVADGAGRTASAVVVVNITPISIAGSEIAAEHGGFVIDGGPDDYLAGMQVAVAGDVDGDGFGDLLVGASATSPAYVVHGGADLENVDLADVASGVGGFRIEREPGPGFLFIAFSARGAGDINGDGLADVVLGGRELTQAASELTIHSYVVFGKADNEPVDLLDVAEGEGGFVIDGVPVVPADDYDEHTHSVAPAGDVDGDGLDDLLVAPYPPSEGDQRAYVVFGKADGAPVDLAAVAAGVGGYVVGGVPGGEDACTDADSRRRVDGAGDINGDGLPDLVLGCQGTRRRHVVFGKADTEPVDLADIALGAGGFVIDGGNAGFIVVAAGDVNGDLLDDVLLNSFDTGPDAIAAYVVFGKADTEPVLLDDVADGNGGFRLESELDFSPQDEIHAGQDVNGDGLADLMLNTWDFGVANRTYVVYGKADTVRVDLADVAIGEGGFVVDPDFQWGYLALGAGDVNGDGLADVAVGQPQLDAGEHGRVNVIFGVSTAPY